jgi:hypothetical protein
LQQEVIVRVLAHGLIEKVDLASIVLEFFEEYHLMDIVASQSIGTRDPNVLNGGLSGLIV